MWFNTLDFCHQSAWNHCQLPTSQLWSGDGPKWPEFSYIGHGRLIDLTTLVIIRVKMCFRIVDDLIRHQTITWTHNNYVIPLSYNDEYNKICNLFLRPRHPFLANESRLFLLFDQYHIYVVICVNIKKKKKLRASILAATPIPSHHSNVNRSYLLSDIKSAYIDFARLFDSKYTY